MVGVFGTLCLNSSYPMDVFCFFLWFLLMSHFRGVGFMGYGHNVYDGRKEKPLCARIFYASEKLSQEKLSQEKLSQARATGSPRKDWCSANLELR
jgi:hypothetical protein